MLIVGAEIKRIVALRAIRSDLLRVTWHAAALRSHKRASTES
jgi:hypothetical protein